ncbi:MAG: hypothetical protein QFB87_02650 [Patescibacteria group bacterium]|nr:hypothetical protein [Patescibacteria group bacterium]
MNEVTQSKPLSAKRTWMQAYQAFLFSRDESLLLKIAPLALLAGSPEIIASNLIPVVGEVADIGGVTLATVVAIRTVHAVRKYRYLK